VAKPDPHRRSMMTICPIALTVTCKKCLAFNVCPLKAVLGDYKKTGGISAKRPRRQEVA